MMLAEETREAKSEVPPHTLDPTTHTRTRTHTHAHARTRTPLHPLRYLPSHSFDAGAARAESCGRGQAVPERSALQRAGILLEKLLAALILVNVTTFILSTCDCPLHPGAVKRPSRFS